MQASTVLHLEPAMKKNPAQRIAASLLSLLVTLALFTAVDHLASRESVSATWAAAVTAPRA
jgi:hypothetical protein